MYTYVFKECDKCLNMQFCANVLCFMYLFGLYGAAVAASDAVCSACYMHSMMNVLARALMTMITVMQARAHARTSKLSLSLCLCWLPGHFFAPAFISQQTRIPPQLLIALCHTHTNTYRS